MIHLQWETTASPAGDLLASPNFGIFDTTQMAVLSRREHAISIST